MKCVCLRPQDREERKGITIRYKFQQMQLVCSLSRAVLPSSLLLCELFQFRFQQKLLSIGISICRLPIKKTFFLFPEFASLVVAARKNIFLLQIENCPVEGIVENQTQFIPHLI